MDFCRCSRATRTRFSRPSTSTVSQWLARSWVTYSEAVDRLTPVREAKSEIVRPGCWAANMRIWPLTGLTKTSTNAAVRSASSWTRTVSANGKRLARGVASTGRSGDLRNDLRPHARSRALPGRQRTIIHVEDRLRRTRHSCFKGGRSAMASHDPGTLKVGSAGHRHRRWPDSD